MRYRPEWLPGSECCSKGLTGDTSKYLYGIIQSKHLFASLSMLASFLLLIHMYSYIMTFSRTAVIQVRSHLVKCESWINSRSSPLWANWRVNAIRRNWLKPASISWMILSMYCRMLLVFLRSITSVLLDFWVLEYHLTIIWCFYSLPHWPNDSSTPSSIAAMPIIASLPVEYKHLTHLLI
jgi:hypothetical protein